MALIHNPELLILDEPTVGVDPELRARIWRYLREIAAGGTTVVITTHYVRFTAYCKIDIYSDRGSGWFQSRRTHAQGIKDARSHAHAASQGKLLAEDTPAALMEHYHCATLEEVFLELCKRYASARRLRFLAERHLFSNPALNKTKTGSLPSRSTTTRRRAQTGLHRRRP